MPVPACHISEEPHASQSPSPWQEGVQMMVWSMQRYETLPALSPFFHPLTNFQELAAECCIRHHSWSYPIASCTQHTIKTSHKTAAKNFINRCRITVQLGTWAGKPSMSFLLGTSHKSILSSSGLTWTTVDGKSMQRPTIEKNTHCCTGKVLMIQGLSFSPCKSAPSWCPQTVQRGGTV